MFEVAVEQSFASAHALRNYKGRCENVHGHNWKVRVVIEGAPPEAGSAILAGDKSVGTMGSSAGSAGLALLRIDRVADALAAGTPLTAGGIAIRVASPDDVLTAPKQTVA